MIIIVFFVILVIVYYQYGWDYAQGCAEYAKINNKGLNESNDCWKSVGDEFTELTDAIRSMVVGDIILEFFDVVHASAKYFVIRYFPAWFYFHWFCWFLVFPIALPSTIKLALRYKKWKCIRNHNRKNSDHRCPMNDNAS